RADSISPRPESVVYYSGFAIPRCPSYTHPSSDGRYWGRTHIRSHRRSNRLHTTGADRHISISAVDKLCKHSRHSDVFEDVHLWMRRRKQEAFSSLVACGPSASFRRMSWRKVLGRT